MGADHESESDHSLIWVAEPLVPIGLLPAPEWLIEGMLPECGLGADYGQPGSFKTWLAIAEAMCLATGLPFCSRRTKRCNVLYIAADDPERPQQRAQAWTKHYEPVLRERGIPVDFSNAVIFKKAVNLHEEGDVVIAAKNIKRQWLKPDIIFFDTLFHSSIGADLNSPEDMLRVVGRARWFMAEVGARAGVIIHHTPKDGKSLFGTNALLASVDVLWRLETATAPNTAKLTCDRMRGARSFDPIELTFQSISLRMAPNSWGDEWIEQLVLSSTMPAAKQKTQEDEDLEMMEFNLESLLGNKATNSAWFEQMVKWTSRNGKQEGWSKSTFNRKLKKLKEDGRVTGEGNQGDFYSVVRTEEAKRARYGGDTTAPAAAAPKAEQSEPVSPKPVSGVIPKGDDTCDTGFDGSKAVSNQCHDTGDTGSPQSRKEENSVAIDPNPTDEDLIKQAISEATRDLAADAMKHLKAKSAKPK
jgi:AAA domain